MVIGSINFLFVQRNEATMSQWARAVVPALSNGHHVGTPA
jgi:hypothetical protein